jgi:hypothetical protein
VLSDEEKSTNILAADAELTTMRALAPPARLAAVALRASVPRLGVRRLARPVRASSSARDGDVIFDAYEILDVRDDATAIDVKDRYRDLQKRFHPDVSGDDPEVLGRSAAINRAYALLIDKERRRDLDDALLRANGGKRRDRATHGGGRAIASAFGLVGPLRERLLARMDVCGGFDLDARACDLNVVAELTEAIREWGKMLAFTSEMPLPLPLQCDDVANGLRIAFVAFADDELQEVGALCITVEKTSTTRGPAGEEEEEEDGAASDGVEVKVRRTWSEKGSRADGGRGRGGFRSRGGRGRDDALPGEGRVLACFAEEFNFLVVDDNLSGPRKKNANANGDDQQGWFGNIVSSVSSFALPVLPMLGGGKVAPGGSYDGYRINRSGSGEFGSVDDDAGDGL